MLWWMCCWMCCLWCCRGTSLVGCDTSDCKLWLVVLYMGGNGGVGELGLF